MRQAALEEIDRDRHGVFEWLRHPFEGMHNAERVASALDDVKLRIVFDRGSEYLLCFFRRSGEVL